VHGSRLEHPVHVGAPIPHRSPATIALSVAISTLDAVVVEQDLRAHDR